MNNFVTNSFVEGLGRAKLAGLTDAVGVSNFKADRVREANKILQVFFSARAQPAIHSHSDCKVLNAISSSLPLETCLAQNGTS